MSLEQCIKDVAGELDLDEDEVREIADRLKRAQRRRKGADRADVADDELAAAATGRGEARTRRRAAETDEEALRAAAAEEAANMRLIAALQRKHQALNALRRNEWVEDIWRRQNEGEGLKAAIVGKMVGSIRGVSGGRRSTWSRRVALEARWVRGMIKEIVAERPHLFRLVQPPLNPFARPSEEAEALFADVRREMVARRDGKGTGNDDARWLADLFLRYANDARLRLNSSGAMIPELLGWAPQSHDARRIGRAGLEAWIEFVLPRLDLERTFPGLVDEAEIRGELAQIYNRLILGQDLETTLTPDLTAMRPGNMAKALHKHRVLHFRDSEAQLDYEADFGRGNVFTAMTDHLHRAARAASLLETMGPNPTLFLENIVGDLRRKVEDTKGISAEERQTLMRQLQFDPRNPIQSSIGRAFQVVSGNTMMPYNLTMASLFQEVRSLQALAKLGSATLSAIADLSTYVAAMRFQGIPVAEGLREPFARFDGVHDPERLMEINLMLGAGADGMLGQIYTRFLSEESLPGVLSGATAGFFRLSGLSGWTDALTSAFSRMASVHMAIQTEKPWAELSEQYRHVLGLHGIDERRWNVIRRMPLWVDEGHLETPPSPVSDRPPAEGTILARHGAAPAAPRRDQRRYLMPELARELDDDAFAELVEAEVASFRESLQKRNLEQLGIEREELELEVFAERREQRIRDEAAREIARARRAQQERGRAEDEVDAAIREIEETVRVRLEEVTEADLRMEFRIAREQGETFDVEPLVGPRRRQVIEEKAGKRRARLVREARRDLETDLFGFFVDEATFAIIKGDDRSSMISTFGTKPGEPLGEAVRLMMQFKTFPITYSHRILGRYLFGGRQQREGRFARTDFGGLAELAAMSLVLGYVAMSAKDISKNKTPRNPLKAETIMAALLQGGGAGIYGDFLFNRFSRFGNSPIDTLAGPAVGTAAELLILMHEPSAAGAFYTALNNTPYINLWYTRAALDWLILYDVQEMLTPGTLRRREQRMQREFGQSFLFSPLPPEERARAERSREEGGIDPLLGIPKDGLQPFGLFSVPQTLSTFEKRLRAMQEAHGREGSAR